MSSRMLSLRLASLALLLFAFVAVGCTERSPGTGGEAEHGLDVTAESDAEYRARIEAWRARREASLREPDSWLSLVGLYWLEPGENTMGSAEGADLVFPPKAPSRLGVLRLEDSTVTAIPAPGVTLTSGGAPVDTLVLYPSAAEGEPVLSWGPLTWYVIERDGRLGIRLKDAESEALTRFDGIPAYEIDRSWQVVGRFEPYDPPRRMIVPTVLGTETEEHSPGALVFERAGTTYRLDVSARPGDEEYFVIFGDATNGRETYGAGRYLYVDAPGADGRVVIDFNKAYNPPCVFSPYATCPFPPKQNRLDLAITAGERYKD